MFIHIYIYTYIHINVYMYIYTYIYVCIHINIFINTHKCVCIHVCPHVYMSLRLCLFFSLSLFLSLCLSFSLSPARSLPASRWLDLKLDFGILPKVLRCLQIEAVRKNAITLPLVGRTFPCIDGCRGWAWSRVHWMLNGRVDLRVWRTRESILDKRPGGRRYASRCRLRNWDERHIGCTLGTISKSDGKATKSALWEGGGGGREREIERQRDRKKGRQRAQITTKPQACL